MLNIDCTNIWAFDRTLYGHLVNYPSEVTHLLDTEAQRILAEITDEEPESLNNLVVRAMATQEMKQGILADGNSQ